MTKIFITSDYHFGDERLSILKRPFDSLEELTSTIINNHNDLVSEDDTVYILGDVCYSKTPEFLRYLKEMKGRKILIRGNHDREITDKELREYFSYVIPEGKGEYLTIDGIECYLTHYPTEGKKNKFNLVGHVHSVWTFQLNMFNVGVDVNYYRPVEISIIPEYLKAIKEFYDEDVWCAYHPINMRYLNKRGKSGTYFKKFTNAD